MFVFSGGWSNLIQIVDVVGVYGLSFLIVLVNTLIFNLFFEERFRGRKILILETSLVTLMMLTTLLIGRSNFLSSIILP